MEERRSREGRRWRKGMMVKGGNGRISLEYSLCEATRAVELGSELEAILSYWNSESVVP